MQLTTSHSHQSQYYSRQIYARWLLRLRSWHNLDFSLIPRYDCMLMLNDGDAPHDLCIIWWSDADNDYLRNVWQHFSNIKTTKCHSRRRASLEYNFVVDLTMSVVRDDPPQRQGCSSHETPQVHTLVSQQEEIIIQVLFFPLQYFGSSFNSVLIHWAYKLQKKMQTSLCKTILFQFFLPQPPINQWIVYIKMIFIFESLLSHILYCACLCNYLW